MTGGPDHSVFEIEGNSNVNLSWLEITGASMDGDHRGGGIYYGGIGGRALFQVSIHDNQAAYGGGIDMNPSGQATLALEGVTISNNTALNDGGGIRIEGSTILETPHASDDFGVDITQNHALG